ncbi:hypothetical protein ACFSUD_18110 [Sulfitobacter aestuarii]|uniref:Transcriptional regulator n=1 Tax=Sulfitobacter aestuarii TaxID=2161676 RepID=A0ABW5U6S2_9RHOB
MRSKTGRSWTYHLTDAGAAFLPLVSALGAWGQRWIRRELTKNALDLGTLIWGLAYSVDPTAFGPDRHVPRLSGFDQPEHKRHDWFLCEAGRLDHCISDPGGETDLFLIGPLKALIRAYRGDVALETAIAEGQREVDGSPRHIRRLGR